MCYKFNENLLSQLKGAFNEAKVKPEPGITGYSQRKNYLSIEFSQPIQWVINENLLDVAVDIILAGDKDLSNLCCSRKPESICNITATLCWHGDSNNANKIVITGLLIALSSEKHRDTAEVKLCNLLGQALLDSQLIHEATLPRISQQFQRAVSQTNNIPKPSHYPHYGWFNKNIRSLCGNQRDDYLAEEARQFIEKNIPLVKKADKVYNNEGASNPVFEKLEDIRKPLLFNEKRIWVLRGNFQLILGVKNAYEFCGYRGLQEALELANDQFIDINDRYGHPSLTQADSDYEGDSVYYAGHIAQRDGYIEVLNYSGRFTRTDISDPKVQILEAYIALQFQQAFGDQPVVFVINARNNYADYLELSLYYADKPLPTDVASRIYTADTIKDILQDQQSFGSRCRARL